jgi:competence transcription factor ComK
MIGITMKPRIIFGTIFMMFVFTLPAIAGGKSELQKHFSDVVNKVKATENASEKREILNDAFQNMSEALDKF